MTDTRVDVAIIGGGMVGASLAVGLAGTGVSTLLVEGTAPGSKIQPSFDDRTTAIGNASRRIFQGLGVWERLAPEAAAIRTIHVSDAGRFGFARLIAAEQGIDAFGYVIPNRVIGAALWERLQGAKDVLLRVPVRPEQVEIGDRAVTFRVGSESVSARLVVAADGAHSVVRAAAHIEADVEDYDQIAIVANVAADRPHDGTAYERFTESGPLAVLPLHDGSYGVIWTCTPARATEVLSFDNNTYLRELQERFGWRAGRFVRAGVRASYPLKLTRAATTVAARTVLIGNAAQALHPVAGQGFNLGLRDAAMLAEVIVGAIAGRRVGAGPLGGAPAVGADANSRPDVGAPELLRQFAAWREGDRTGVVRFTDGLVKMFASTRPGVGALRNLGLLLFDLSPPAKSALARVSAGFSGPTPRLARGLALL
ncbi:MAG: 2-octaprenyl-6-methoxyphenol hydroxylase [Gammaproteobacteria bacterium]|jgi:2-octaprenyl-6-methoxyphenol hydroxylase|nr:2-octaprenyl-6-methoxyphenol hydroxylase [Gammaproteobacteria bacterium]